MDQEQFEADWVATQRAVFALQGAGDYKRAMQRIDEYMQGDLPPYFKSEALAVRSDLLEEQGQYVEALDDMEKAWEIAEAGTYARYTLELSLGGLCEKLKQTEKAEDWYRRALETCVAGRDFSGGSALRSLLTLRPQDELSQADTERCAQAIRRSWEHFNSTPEVDVNDFMATARTLLRKESTPPAR